jgi:hypothetical protein
MSTTTNFKRVALVAVAALGLGVLSSVPSNAAINADVLTISKTSAAQTTAETYTSTAAVASIAYTPTVAGDSITLTASLVSGPAGSSSLPYMRLVETTSSGVDSVGTAAQVSAAAVRPINTGFAPNVAATVMAAAASTATGAKFAVYVAGASGTAAPTVGTYVVKVTPAAVTGSGALQAAAAVTVTITVTEAASLDTKAAAATSTIYLQGTGGNATAAAYDSTVVAAKTASATSVGFIQILEKNAAGTSSAVESLTVSTNIGTLQSTDGTNLGRSLLVAASGAAVKNIFIAPDGNAGVATITVTTASGVLLGSKKVTFFDSLSTLTGAAVIATETSVVAVSGLTKVYVAAKDSAANIISNLAGGTDIYAFSSDTSVATVGTVQAWDATNGYHAVVTGVAVGTATITFGNASTLAASTIKSNAATVRVGSATANSVVVTFDKATYAPGEKATMTITVNDSTGKATVGGDKTSIFATGGITTSVALGSTSDSITGTSVLVSGVTNTKTYTLYMPTVGGAVKFSWTGGTALATANQVAGSATVTVTDSGAAALAAVTALATTVASLKTLITTLTNLVLKIQKKVKA